jgi:iron complex outermembrane receptor protein
MFPLVQMNFQKERKNKLLDAYLVYNKTFDKLVFDATAGYS